MYSGTLACVWGARWKGLLPGANFSLHGRGALQRGRLQGAAGWGGDVGSSLQQLQLDHLPRGGTVMLQEVGQACSSALQTLVAPGTLECEIVRLGVKK